MPYYYVIIQWHLDLYFKILENIMLEINISVRVVCTNMFSIMSFGDFSENRMNQN